MIQSIELPPPPHTHLFYCRMFQKQNKKLELLKLLYILFHFNHSFIKMLYIQSRMSFFFFILSYSSRNMNVSIFFTYPTFVTREMLNKRHKNTSKYDISSISSMILHTIQSIFSKSSFQTFH